MLNSRSFPKHSVTFYLNTEVASGSRNRKLVHRLEELHWPSVPLNGNHRRAITLKFTFGKESQRENRYRKVQLSQFLENAQE